MQICTLIHTNLESKNPGLVLTNKIIRHKIVLSFKDSPRTQLGRRPRNRENEFVLLGAKSDSRDTPIIEGFAGCSKSAKISGRGRMNRIVLRL